MMRCKVPRLIVMTAGPQGSGRSTLLNNLLRKPIVEGSAGSEINIYVIGREEDRTHRQITYIETPGFGQASNEETVYDSIVEYIKEQLDSYIEEESKIRRNPNYEDTRVQCLIYAIPATGNGLKQSDIVFLKKVSEIVNIIPVITKSDILSSNEKRHLKCLITDQLTFYKINVFRGLTDENLAPEGGTYSETLFPFTVICSDECVSQERSREHVAGHVEIENSEVSDLQILREVILRTHTDMLAETTAIDIYEKYRAEALESVMSNKEDY